MVTKISNTQIRKIHAILNQNGRVNTKAKQDLVRRFTGNHHLSSTKDLSFDQANNLIQHLGGAAVGYENWAFFDKTNKRHCKILSLCHELEWVYFDKELGTVVDLKRLSEWLRSYRCPVRKPILKMTGKELSKIISALENMLTKSYKK